MTDKEKVTIFGCISMGLSLPFVIALRGYALSVVWGWFLVPILHVPAITVMQAIALALVINSFVDVNTTTDKSENPISAYYAKALGGPLGILLMAYIYRMFM